MKMNFKKGLALLVAITLVVTTLSFTAGNTLRASDDEGAYTAETQAAQEKKEEPKAEPKKEEPKQETKAEPKQEATQKVVDEQEVSLNDASGDGEPAITEATEGTAAKQNNGKKKPAAKLSKKAGYISVAVNAPEGALPEGTTMKANPLSAEKALKYAKKVDSNATDAAGVEITFVSDSSSIEPDKNVEVTLSGLDVDGGNYKIIHVNDKGSINKVNGSASKSKASFKASDFSSYIVYGTSNENNNETNTESTDETSGTDEEEGEQLESSTDETTETEPIELEEEVAQYNFNAGVFGDSSYAYLGKGSRFTVTSSPSEPVNAGESFTFKFATTESGLSGTTDYWWLNSLQLNGKKVKVPTNIDVNNSSSASTNLSDCNVKVTASVSKKTSSNTPRTINYTISMTDVNSDIKFTAANLNRDGEAKKDVAVVPSIDQGVNFTESSLLGIPKRLRDGAKYNFSIKDGYKDLAVHMDCYDLSHSNVLAKNISLPTTAGATATITGKVGGTELTFGTIKCKQAGSYCIEFTKVTADNSPIPAAGVKLIDLEITTTAKVVVPPTIELSASDVSIDYVGETAEVEASVENTESNVEIEWESSDEDVATVDDGVITAMGKGQAKVMALLAYTDANNVEKTVTEKINVSVRNATQKPTLSITPTTASFTYIGQTKTITPTVKNAGDDAIVEWISSNEEVATVEGGVITAKGAGTATITAKLTYYDDDDTEQTITKDVAVTVTFSKYIIYHYALIPGKSADDTSGSADERWFGIGETYITGAPAPTSLSIGTKITDFELGGTAEGKTLYPDLTYGGKTYKYAAPGTANASEKGYYTLQPYRVTVAGGANSGSNGYNNYVGSGNTYHYDYLCVINEQSNFTVNFAVKYPGSTSFESLTDSSATSRVKDGTSETAITKPKASLTPNTQLKDGITYQFDGWYRDEACTDKCDFDQTITSNTTYYAKYNATNQKYKVQYYYDNVLDSTATETLGPVAIGTEITTYTDKAKTGYTLLKDTAPLTVSADASQNIINVYYTKRTVPYTVNYYIENTTTKVATSVVASGKYDSTVTGTAKEVAGYTLVGNATEKSITLGSGTNEINFYYSKNIHTVSYEWTGDVPAGETVPASFTKAYGDIYSIDTKYNNGYVVNVNDAYGNLAGVYTFSGWNKTGQQTMGDADVTVTGSWSYEGKTITKHGITYSWTGLPTDKLYNADGDEVTPELPVDEGEYVNNQPYSVDETMPGTVVYTHDAYGNKNASYTLSAWNDPNSGVMGASDVTITATWVKASITVAEHSVTYDWGTDAPAAAVLPTDNNKYVKGQTYNVDTTYSEGTTVNHYDAYDNVDGVYTFSGWTDPENGVMGTEDVTVTGSWSYEETNVPQHNVTYAWTGLPNATLYDHDGNVVTPAYPTSITGLVKNQEYTIDTDMPGTVVYTHDAYGNKTASYTLGAWADPGAGKMGEKDIEVTAAWSMSEIPVAEHTVTYSWTGNAPSSAVLPTDSNKYVKGQNYTVDSTYTSATVINRYDAYGNVNGTYTFSGWTPASGQQTMGAEDVTVTGEWTFTEQTVPQHKVEYSWGGLPSGTTFYDLAGNQVTTPLPSTISPLVNNQPYTVDGTYTTSSYVLTHDDWGNVNGRYNFSGWTDPGNGIMGEADITVTGSWKYQAIIVATHDVTYKWTGDVPAGVTIPDDITGLANNQPYTVDTTYSNNYSVTSYDAYGNVNGAYVFSGWTDPGNGKMGTAKITVEGTWTFNPTTVATHNVSYNWENMPNETVYSESGAITTPVVPSTIAGLVKNQGYTIDSQMPGTEIYTHDAYGNVNCKYTLSAWNDPNSGTMGEADVTVTAKWVADPVEVPEYSVTYNWGDNAPVAGTAGVKNNDAVTLPTNGNKYVKGQTYSVDATYGANYSVNTYDAYGNINGTYTFSGWTPASGQQTMGAADVTVTGSWTYTPQTVAKHSVVYSWTGLPTEKVYDAEGTEVTPTVPVDDKKYVNGQGYTVDASKPGTVVYTHDAYGNINAEYTLSNWTDPNGGTMGNADVSVTAEWTGTPVEVTDYSVTYNWGDKAPVKGTTGVKDEDAVVLPTDASKYVKGQPYSVDATYTAEYTVNTYDKYDNVNGVYTFSGWTPASGQQTMGEANVEVTGSWSYEKTDVPQNNVTYSWTGLPEDTVYDADGNEVTPSVPASITGLVKNQTYTIDKSMPGTVVYTHDAYGNKTASYTLGAWTDPAGGKMGESPIEVKAEWTSEAIDVPVHSVTYSWGENAPVKGEKGVKVEVTLPADNNQYANNQPYTVDGTFTSSTTVNTYDAYGNVNGTYTFSGWTDPKNGVMGTADVTVTGSWTYTPQTVAAHSVTYGWTGLPDATLYDAYGKVVTPVLPNAITGLVNNQPYEIDKLMPGTVVYTQDAYGNKTASYTLGKWDDPGKGKMGESNIEVTAAWTNKNITVEAHNVHYYWGDKAPVAGTAGVKAADAVVLPTDESTYVRNQGYTIDTKYSNGYTVNAYDDYGNINGTYTFSGWTDPKNGVMGTADVTVSGSWTYTPKTVAKHSVVYSWTGLPTETVYDAEGDEVTPELPVSITNLVKGQGYTVDTDKPGTVVYTHDAYGNINASYTLSNWTDTNSGTMGDADVPVTATWTRSGITVPEHTVTYNWGDKAPVKGTTGVKDEDAVVLPTDEGKYVKGQPYSVDATYTAKYTVNTYDAYDNVNGVYTFGGWTPASGQQTMGTANVEVTGSWSYEKTDVAQNNVTYSWTGLPEDTVYDADGNAVTPTVPASITGLVKNQTYTIDTAMPGTVVYTHDAYGNKNASYTLGAWKDPAGGKMGESPIEVTAEWTSEAIDVPVHSVTYSWGETAPVKGEEGVKVDVTLPTDNNQYANNQPYTIDGTYTSVTTVNTHDIYGNVNGTYSFSGWTDPKNGVMGTADVTVTGSWTYTPQDVATHNVTYSWTGLPDATLYTDADEETVPAEPASITGLVKNQPYTIDTAMPGTVVYTHDAYGNKTASYTLGAWTDPGKGKMGESNIEVTAEWAKQGIEVPRYKVTYKYTDATPAKAPAVAEATYFVNQTVEVAEDPTLDGYTFTGWKIEGEAAPASFKITGDVEIVGEFTPNDTAYVVEYYKETLETGKYELADSNNMTAKTDSEVTATINSYDGFTYNAEKSTIAGNVLADGSLVLKVYYDRNSYEVTYEYNGTVPSGATALPAKKSYKFGQKVTVAAKATAPGYDFVGWESDPDMKPLETPELTEFQMPSQNVTIYGIFGVRGDTKYTVEHYLVEPDGSETLGLVDDSFTGETDTEITAMPVHFIDYTYAKGYDSEVATGIIAGDGSLVLKLYYTRNIYNLTIHYVDKKGKTVHEDYVDQMISGTKFKIKSPSIDGYVPNYSSISSGAAGMPMKNLEFTVIYKLKPIAVTTGVDGDNQTPEGVAGAIRVTPGGTTIIEDNPVPTVPAEGAWALLNLLLTILSVIISLGLLIMYFVRRKQEEEGDYDNDGDNNSNKAVPRIASAIWAILMIIVFAITEDTSLPMAFVDKWTILMVVMTLIQLGIMVVSKKKKKDNDQNTNTVQA